jgi:hypothetical protein
MICQSLRDDAKAVFFKRNRFVITPGKRTGSSGENTLSRLHISTFLKDTVPSDALRFLRFIDIALPSLDEDYSCPQESMYDDWLGTIDFVKTNLHLRNLTLRIYMADEGLIGNRNNAKATERAIRLFRAYRRVLAPLSNLEGLSKCFVHLERILPWASGEGRGRRNVRSESVERVEKSLERLIMGNDYDSAVFGKLEKRPSGWLMALGNDHYYG